MLATDKNGIPLAGIISSASVSEYNLIFPTLEKISVEKRPNHPIKKTRVLIADKGYDARWVRKGLRRKGITPYIPKRRRPGRKDEPKYNERIKPYYKTRWIVERTFSWLGNYRRILIRWERKLTTYSGFFHIACFMVCLNQVLK